MTLFIQSLGIKQRCDKKLTETVKRFSKSVRQNIKEETGMFCASPCIIRTAMLTDKSLKIANFRVFFCAQKQHVFEIVSQTLAFDRIVKVPDVDR
ncbi:Uncharacterised protein [Vibrio cholerae]|nr:Uncharacterised protein [Vibrio cholerae]CRZ73939.1 Uncharacterised protein [Vibrio cholerae]CRZ74521.1 Uncharacterised protein [Vibrio cholerae]CSB21761.1 Uncharacterised protein [Vibrio cholerae]